MKQAKINDKCKKVKFADEVSADITMRQIIKIENEKEKPIRSYKCNMCNFWHLTSKPDYKIMEKENVELKNKIVELESKIIELTDKWKTI